MDQLIPLPQHAIPCFHRSGIRVSFEHYYTIHRVYKPIIGQHGIDDIAIHIATPDDELVVLSFNPGIIYRMYQDKTFVYNGALSPTHYRKRAFYLWEDCHDAPFRETMIKLTQQRFGFNLGLTFVRKAKGFCILYCFATKRNRQSFLEEAVNDSSFFIKTGDRCFNALRHLYIESIGDHTLPTLECLQESAEHNTASNQSPLQLVVDNTKDPFKSE